MPMYLEMYLQINIALLSASAIVASLMTYRTKTLVENMVMRFIIFTYGVSSLLSASGIIWYMLTVDANNIEFWITFLAVISFLTATEFLLLGAGIIFSNKKKEQK
ncbi:hypothetical protein MUP77_10665 [Candidatus Bathyarchaeota archaeon]|nr:hypothetical protein [Candidatus Bathyarchaeota archaeon]